MSYIKELNAAEASVRALSARVAELEEELASADLACLVLLGSESAALEEIARLDAGWHALRARVAELKGLLLECKRRFVPRDTDLARRVREARGEKQ